MISEVIILNDYASLTGGSSAVAIASALGLASRGVAVTYFSAVGPVAPQLVDVPGLQVICLDQQEIAKDAKRLRAFTSGLRNGAAVTALRALLATKDPARTIVHAHTWMKALSPFALEEVTARGFRLVVTLHDFFITCPNGGFFDYKRGRICRRKPLSPDCLGCQCDRRNYGHKLWRSARTALQNKVLRLPSKVSLYIGVTDFSLDIMRPYIPASIPATVVRNPVDCVDERPADNAANDTFLYIGRFVPEKGPQLFAAAARAAGVPATFIGDGELMADLRRMCPEATFTGWLQPAEIRAHLRRARALVFPPLWYETLGLVAIEAAASGVPPIVADRCAATDYIQHGKTGLMFTHGSVQSLTDRLTAVARDDELASRLGREAYQWYWDDPWTTERHVTDLIDAYQSSLEQLVATANHATT
ncbi:MAG TPA: glycosyltransferase family 4 protein [Opitutaceae bacterium]